MRKLIASACLVAGFALLAVAGGRVVGAQSSQRAVQAQVASWVELPPADEPTPPKPMDEVNTITPPLPTPAPKRAYEQGDPLFRLEIPRIEVNNIVVYGSTEAALKVGPGLIEGTPLPGDGGNTVISAHRDFYFWGLGELEPGDELRITSPAGSWTYTVTSKRVIKETQTEVLDQTPQPTVTLITCWPLIYAGRTPDRLVVTAVRTDHPSGALQIQ